MSVLNHIDRFIVSLWERNDQLSVYNPQIKTQYDTYSWVKDIGGRDLIKAKEFIQLYKLDLLESLMQNDNFPLQYIEDDGITFMRWALSRDIRNMLRWIRGPRGQGGPQAIKETNGTYEAVISRIINDSISLDTRKFQNEGDGLRYAEFVNIVRQGFKPGNPSVNIFGFSADDDYGHFASNYFWFMYGILPRNGITLDSLRGGLTQPEPNIDDTRNTFKFLGLLYNLKSEKVEILRGPDKDGKPDVEGIYDFIDPWKEVPRPFDHKVMYVDKAHNELHQRQEKDKNVDGKTTSPTSAGFNVQDRFGKLMGIGGDIKTDKFANEVKDKVKSLKSGDFDALMTKFRDESKNLNGKTDKKDKDKKEKLDKINSILRNQKKVASSSERTSNERPVREQRPSTPVEQRRQNTPPRQTELRQQSTPPRQTEPRRQQSPPQRQTSVTPSLSVQSFVSTTPQFFPLDESEDEDPVQPDTTKVPPASRSVAKDPTQTGASSIAAPVPTAPIPAPKRDANSAKPGNRGNLTRATALGGGRKPIAATAPAGKS